jgi:hypothetical protein
MNLNRNKNRNSEERIPPGITVYGKEKVSKHATLIEQVRQGW